MNINKQKYIDSNHTPNEKTLEEIENLNKHKEDLSNFNLKGAQLENVYLVNASMKKCNLTKANLKNASMFGVDLRDSELFKTDFENANLKNAKLEGANLLGANLTNTKLENIDWGRDYKIINEIEAEEALNKGDHELANKKYKESEEIYRTIKISMQSQTLGDDTGKFFIREMISRRKQLKKYSLSRIGSKIIELTTGYGEKLSNIGFTIIGIILLCMVLYGIEGISYSDPVNGSRIIGFFSDDMQNFGLLNTLGNLFYFSVVVYSTVGFGEMLPIGPIGKAVMIFEGITGGLVLAILIIALYKKTMDR
tara:strand:+ start:118 stop:1044 length:927 start_codon:yes stop_codon:yes gene_type:complete